MLSYVSDLDISIFNLQKKMFVPTVAWTDDKLAGAE
jgi:hypothetical protein